MPKKSGRGHGLLDFGLGAISAGAILSIIAGGYKTAEFIVHAKRLTEVGHENAVYVRIMERVRLDLAEADRLLHVPEVKEAMRRSPEKLGWIKRAIEAMRVAIQEMNKYTKQVQMEVDSGRWIGWRTRFWWILDESEKAMRCRGEVGICHEGLLEVLGFLSALEPVPCAICEEEDEQNQQRGQYEDPERYEDPEDYEQQQRRYEEQARAVLQNERAGQYRNTERSERRREDEGYASERDVEYREERPIQMRDNTYETEREVQYREERPVERRGNDAYIEREREVEYREERPIERRRNDTYIEKEREVEYREYEEPVRRRETERYTRERGGHIDTEVRVSKTQEYGPRNGRDRVVYDRNDGPREEGPARLRVHWPSNL